MSSQMKNELHVHDVADLYSTTLWFGLLLPEASYCMLSVH